MSKLHNFRIISALKNFRGNSNFTANLIQFSNFTANLIQFSNLTLNNNYFHKYIKFIMKKIKLKVILFINV